MLPQKKSTATEVLSVLLLSSAIATSAYADAPAKAKAANSKLPVVEETIVVTEVELQPVNLASKLLASNAYMNDGTKIGDVSDIVLDSSNKVTAVVVGVGGFLGIDETYIAIPISKITYEQDGSNFKIVADVTKDELKKAKKTT